ncbi:hypothetical protein ACFVYV_09420 [Streptomyces mirabilis]|uniref:hypothetical protein n=1 Tax=Streptomyces mirabilis TaxID=68239 RepID=UPI0036D81DC9
MSKEPDCLLAWGCEYPVAYRVTCPDLPPEATPDGPLEVFACSSADHLGTVVAGVLGNGFNAGAKVELLTEQAPEPTAECARCGRTVPVKRTMGMDGKRVCSPIHDPEYQECQRLWLTV